MSGRFILNYLRDSYIGLDSFGEADLRFLEELSHEAQFFNISGLCADISRRRVERSVVARSWGGRGVGGGCRQQLLQYEPRAR